MGMAVIRLEILNWRATMNTLKKVGRTLGALSTIIMLVSEIHEAWKPAVEQQSQSTTPQA